MILTAMNQQAMDDDAHRAKLEKQIPLGRAGRADEVARVAVYLASPNASYITGTTVVIDGGLSLLMGQGRLTRQPAARTLDAACGRAPQRS